MIHIGKTGFTRDIPNKKITVTREFAAPLQRVWDAFTQAHLLDQWWAPRPYKAETKIMDFRPGGQWLYCMAGPAGDRSWVRVDFKTIQAPSRFESSNVFADADGNTTNEYPGMHWKCDFKSTATGTEVTIELTFDTDADLQTVIELGIEGGTAMGHNNLDELLSQN